MLPLTETMPSRTTIALEFEELVARHHKRSPKPIEPEKIQRVKRFVIDGIQRGDFRPGHKIVELQLAGQLNMSCVPIREAMSKLEQEGWVVRVHNKGIYVKKLDIDDIKELYFIRQMIEATAIDVMAPKITESELAELQKLSDVIESARTSLDMSLVEQADSHFHRLLVHFTGNKHLKAMYESILVQASGVFFQLTDKVPQLAEYIYSYLKDADHRNICEALASHDIAKARRLVDEHLRIGFESIRGIRALMESLKPKMESNGLGEQ